MSIVVTEDRGPVRHVVLNRPEKRNAMNQELLLALGAALREAAADPTRALRRAARRRARVLGRRGPQRAGATRPASVGHAAPVPHRCSSTAPNLCEEMAKPVVCQIHRTCVGGALEVALGCDLRIAVSDAQLGLPEVKFGIIPDVGGSTRAARRGRASAAPRS